ncbi:MAG: glycerol-3-phosphate 1-O-acyltransferase PlsY [Dehalococcoidia bacterium]|nr:glycerol-3-phosphate 1-O-acyltransferase PlsY [Dehalococcoidia bacterium]
MLDQIILIAVCYLIGAIPVGFLIVRLTRSVDIRDYGSGNIGMTNVLRTTGLKTGIIVLGLDTFKGVIPVFVSRQLYSDPYMDTLAAIAVLVGHIWPVFLKFRGGKGVATGMGSFCFISPICGLIVVGVGCLVLAVSRYVSLASIIAASSAFISMWVFNNFYSESWIADSLGTYIMYPLIGVPIIIFRHRENIARLLNGEERRLGSS